MKAMVLEEFGKELVYRDIPAPEPQPGEALVRVSACGLCGTDLKIAAGKIASVPRPQIMGHEVSGEVVAVNWGDRKPSASGVRVGSRVAVYVYVSCGQCINCMGGNCNICTGDIHRIGIEIPGGLAEYLTAPIANLFPIPPSVQLDEACILSDAVIVAMHAIKDRARVQPFEDVVILGAGGIGVHAVQICDRLGARVIAVDIRDECLRLAEQMGAHACVNSRESDLPSVIADLTGGLGADVVLDMVGKPETLALSMELLRRGGRAVSVGYSPGQTAPVDTLRMHMNELTLLGTRHGTRQNLVESIRMAEQCEINLVVGEKAPLQQANSALDALRHNQVLGRLILVP